jgi:type II secretory pathway pseudopilin PulG
VIAIILIIITIALPRLSRARMYSQETAAIGAIRTLHTAQVQYYSQYGKYAASLTELGPPTSGAAGPAASDLIGNDLSGGIKSGYRFTLSANQGGYVINANPDSFGNSGSRTFYSDQSMVIRQNYGQEPATANSAEMK